MATKNSELDRLLKTHTGCRPGPGDRQRMWGKADFGFRRKPTFAGRVKNSAADIGVWGVVVDLLIKLASTGELQSGLRVHANGLVEKRVLGVARVVELGFACQCVRGGGRRTAARKDTDWALRTIASAAAHISGGLLSDLGHILEHSDVPTHQAVPWPLSG